MFVVATAGHVDHGKSTLIGAVTGMEPDRLAEERRRGLTIDLGFTWAALPSGAQVAFVDVPGHERFLANALTGLGPAPVVCFVVAADEGWQPQSTDHRNALAALGVSHGVIALTRIDRADRRRVDDVGRQVRHEFAGTGLHDAPMVQVCAVDGRGIADLRSGLDRVLMGLPAPDRDCRVRLWIDRRFTIAGAGTVVTGTLTAGTLTVGDRLELLSGSRTRSVSVRGLQSCGESYETLAPTARVAVNLRGIGVDEVRRGDALVTPGTWPAPIVCDAAVTGLSDIEEVSAHVGSAVVRARVRYLGNGYARLTLDHPVPMTFSDRLVLRATGSPHVLGGARVLDVDPPELRRRGDAARRSSDLASWHFAAAHRLRAEVARRGAVRPILLRRLGYDCTDIPPEVQQVCGFWVDTATYLTWQRRLRTALEELDPLSPGLSRGAARDLLAIPDATLIDAVASDAGLCRHGGYLRLPSATTDLGTAETAIVAVECRLTSDPFHPPEADDLRALHLGTKELAAAERAGRLLRLAGGIVLLPTAPALAMRELSRLPQPFTATEAKRALNTTRRVAIPLLEHLDARGWTRRIDTLHRVVVVMSKAATRRKPP